MKTIANALLHFIWNFIWISYKKITESKENTKYIITAIFGVTCIIILAVFITTWEIPKPLIAVLIFLFCGIISSLIMDIWNDEPEDKDS